MENKEKKSKKIPIVMATDENYLFFTCVAISSIAKSAKEGTFYQLYILVSSGLDDRDCLFDSLQQRYSNIHIEIVRIDDSLFQNVKINNSHVTKATFYRLALCELIKEEKCLYLDSDILVTEDLKTLYQTELGNNYLAGCRDIWVEMFSEPERDKRCVATRIPSMAQYINAGVLLFNLKQIREDGIDRLFLEQMNQNYPHEDQDILNVCCFGKILHLSAKWNIFTVFMGQMNQMQEVGIKEEELEAYRNRRGIFHYATAQARPWEREDCWLGREWWQIAREWEKESAYQRFRDKIYKKELEGNWEYYFRICKQSNRIVIFGYTKYSRELCEWIKRIKNNAEIVFCDNNEEKQGLWYQNIPILSFQDIVKASVDSIIFFVASQTKALEIQQFLVDNGIREEQIVVYRRKGENYYQYLDDRYYRRELQDICKKENLDWKIFGSLSKDEIYNVLCNNERFQNWTEKYYMDKWLLKG